MLNTFSGIGRLGHDPDIIKKEDSITAKFSIAINEFYKEDNDLHKKTHWIPCITFGRLAEIAGEFLTKGSQVGIRGPLRLNTWDGNNGKKMQKLEVIVNELEFLSTRLEDKEVVYNGKDS